MKAHFLQLATQPVENQATGESVVRRPVVVELRQTQGIGHNVQLELPQLGQQILGENQGIQVRGTIGNPQPAAGGRHKAHIKVRVMGNQWPVAAEGQKPGKNLPNIRGAP